jgi:hypothetical protein
LLRAREGVEIVIFAKALRKEGRRERREVEDREVERRRRSVEKVRKVRDKRALLHIQHQGH